MQWLYQGFAGNPTISYNPPEEYGVIFPIDHGQCGSITSSEMHDFLVRPLEHGVRLTAIFDDYYNASPLELPFIYDRQMLVKQPELPGKSLPQTRSSCAVSSMLKAMTHSQSFAKKDDRCPKLFSPADVMVFTSRNICYFYMRSEPSLAHLTTSSAFMAALNLNQHSSYATLLSNMETALFGSSSKTVRLTSSHPIGICPQQHKGFDC